MKPIEIVNKMLFNDAFTKALDMEVIHCKKGKVDLKLTVNDNMVNGFKIAHGAITYALADSALAFSSNTHGFHAVSVDTSIKHLMAVQLNDELHTSVEEVNKTKKIGVYLIKIRNQNKDLVAIFNGTVYFKSNSWSY